jgi:diguanylate cyclase (GGDEF)-like protein
VGMKLTAGKLAAFLFMGAGALSTITLLLPQAPGVNRTAVAIVSASAVVIGVVVLLLPWDRWPRRATLVLLPLAFTLISVGNYFGAARQPYTYGIFFVVAFVWIGISHARWTSLAFAPLAAIGFLAPILARSDTSGGALAAAVLTIPVCVLVGESLARVSTDERRSRESAHSLARVAQALVGHLDLQDLAQTLVDEARSALRAEQAVLVHLDPEAKTVTDVFASGLRPEAARRLQEGRGMRYESLPRIDTLSRGQPIVVSDVEHSPGDQDLLEYELKSYVAMPVMAHGDLVGILWCSELSSRRRYDADDLSLAGALAGQAGSAFENARLYERAVKASRSDAMTGLANRRAFHEQLEAEVARARRHGRPIALLIMDADRLKEINDAWGHVAGDRVIRRLASVLENQPRPENLPYRIGGDEFALVLPETDAAAGMGFAEELRHRIETERLGAGVDLQLTVSVGVASFPEHAINADELFERADTAMFEVKRFGGNAVAVAVPRAATDGAGVAFGIDLAQVIADEHLVPRYQPIFVVETGEVLGYEAFCGIDPRFGPAPTQSLFRAAGALGMVDALDAACRTVALSAAAGLGADRLLFINVTPAALSAPGFSPDAIISAAARSGIAPGQVVIELTEQERSPGTPRLRTMLRACLDAGLKLALDDFGAAGADLELMARVAFDFVKIDSGFVRDAQGEAARIRLLAGLGIVSSEAGAQVIAEGVETVADLEIVRDLGFRAAQGYLLRRPAAVIEPVGPPPGLGFADHLEAVGGAG